jgi:hypothetical protein
MPHRSAVRAQLDVVETHLEVEKTLISPDGKSVIHGVSAG